VSGLAVAVERALLRTFVDDNGCWVFAGAKSYGYGRMQFRLPSGALSWLGVHRAVYLYMVGDIPEGLVLDHLCRNRACCNPDHLEPVSNWENLRRGQGFVALNASKTHCENGHPYDSANTRIKVENGRAPYRTCRACKRLSDAKRDRSRRG
jgi:hypothetical protein